MVLEAPTKDSACDDDEVVVGIGGGRIWGRRVDENWDGDGDPLAIVR